MKQLLAVLLLLPALAVAGVRYVSPTGSSGNTGLSTSSPWNGPTADANIGTNGIDTIWVMNGTYTWVINPQHSIVGQNVVYKAINARVPVITGVDGDVIYHSESWYVNSGHGTVPDPLVMYISGSTQRVVIDGLKFRPREYDGGMGWWMNAEYMIQLNGDYTVMKNCVIDPGFSDPATELWVNNSRIRGIVIAGSYITVMDCRIRALEMGIVVATGADAFHSTLYRDTVTATFASNIVFTCDMSHQWEYKQALVYQCILDTSFNEDNVQINGDYSDNSVTGVLIRECFLGHAGENAIDPKGGSGINAEGNFVAGTLNDDDGCQTAWLGLIDPDGHGGSGSAFCLGVPSRNNNREIYRFNIMYDNGTAISMFDGDQVYNNTLLNNRRSWQGANRMDVGRSAVQQVQTGSSPGLFLNNIAGGQRETDFSDVTYPGGNSTYLIVDNPSLRVDHNLYYEPPDSMASGPRFMLRIATVPVHTYTQRFGLASWQNLLNTTSMDGKEANSLQGDPLFASVPSSMYPILNSNWNIPYDFHPDALSPALGNGGALATVTGVNGTTITLSSALPFRDDWGIGSPWGLDFRFAGDSVQIGNTAPVEIIGVDYAANTITTGESRAVSSGNDVYLFKNGRKVDYIGALYANESTPENPPDPPVLSSPSDNATDVSVPPTFTWEAAAGATSYVLRVSDEVELGSVVYQRSAIYCTSEQAVGLQGATTYYWSVRSQNSAGTSGWSTGRAFTTAVIPPPDAPILSVPLDGATDVSTSPTFSWNAVSGALTYTVHVSTVSDFSSYVYSRSAISLTSQQVVGLSTETTYYWRVSATNLGGTSGWSAVQSFFTTANVPPVSSGMRTVLLRK